jgi:flagellar motor switch protein FliG
MPATPAIKGSRKAAILMVLLGEEVASSIYNNLPSNEVEAITEEIAQLKQVPPELAREILEEYYRLTLTQEYVFQGGIDFATRLLVKAFGEATAKELLARVVHAQEVSAYKLDSLQKADPQQLAKFLEGEHPQTMALTLAHLDGKQASSLLMKLPENVRADVVKRLSQLRQFSPEMAEKVSMVLNRRLQSLGEQSRRSYTGFKGVADLMNRLEPTAAKSILESIEGEDPKLAISIRNLMFTFEDLLGVTETGIRELLANLDRKILTLALKGATQELKTHVMKTMSSRAVDMLKEDMEALGPVRGKDVVKAQQDVVAVARKLEAEGKIVLRAEGEDEYIV